MTYRTSQQQTNDIFSFGMILMMLLFTVMVTKSLVTEEKEGERTLLPMTKSGKPVVTVTCPICRKIIEIPDYSRTTRSEALKQHIDQEHSSSSRRYSPAVLRDEGEMIPFQYHDLLGWIDIPPVSYTHLTLPTN